MEKCRVRSKKNEAVPTSGLLAAGCLGELQELFAATGTNLTEREKYEVARSGYLSLLSCQGNVDCSFTFLAGGGINPLCQKQVCLLDEMMLY